MFKNFILYSSKSGQIKRGVEKTPNILRFLLPKIDNFNILDTSINNNLHLDLYTLYNNNNSVKYPKVNIGGDHSMSIATIQDSLLKYPDIKVIWIDAHPDINTSKSSKTNNYHGMPLALLTGLENDPSLSFQQNLLPFKNILYIGIRDIDPFEKYVIERYNINYISINDFINIEKVVSKIKEFVNNSPIHVSFDVDSIDPKFIPCTGTPVENGLGLFQCRVIFETIFKEKVINVDLTELNLSLGTLYDKEKSIQNLTYLFKNIIF